MANGGTLPALCLPESARRARDVAAVVAAALIGLHRPRRLRLDLVPTPDGIRLIPVSIEIDTADSFLALPAPATPAIVPDYATIMAPLRQADADLLHRSSHEHARALLSRLQGDHDCIGTVPYELVRGAYDDLLIELQWAPRPWSQVSQELRSLAGARKRYVNGKSGCKVLVFDIPGPDANYIRRAA